MAEAPSDNVGDNLDRLLQSALQQLRDKCFGPLSAEEFLKSLWTACELDTGPPTSGNPTEAHFLQTAFDLVVTPMFEAAKQGERIFAPEQVVFFLICVLAGFPTTMQHSEPNGRCVEFRCQHHATLLHVTRDMLFKAFVDWRDIDEVLKAVLQLMRVMETKRQGTVLYITDILFSVLYRAHHLRLLTYHDFRTRADTWDGHLLYWFGMLQISALIQLGFLDSANRIFETAIPSFVGSQMTDDLKIAYNCNKARLCQHSGQYDQALQYAQHALDLTQEEGRYQELKELIQTLTVARDIAQSTVDNDWLQDTNANPDQTQRQANKQRKIQEQHKSKGKHRRPKRAVPTDNATPCVDNKPAHVPTPNTVHVSHSRGIANTVLSTSPSSTAVSTQRLLLPSVWRPADDSTRSKPTRSATCESEDDSSEEDHGDATGAPPTVNYFHNNQDRNENSEDLVEKVVALLPEEGEDSWYDYSVNGSYPEQKNIYISDVELRKHEKPSNRPPFYPELKTDRQEIQQMLKTEPEKYKRCQLISLTAHEAQAKVLDSSASLSHIWIHGRSKIGRTFLEEEVVVELLAQPQQGAGRADSTATMVSRDRLAYGQVVASLGLTRYSDVCHPVFLCTVDDWDYNLMLPLCRTVPKIQVLKNSPKREVRAEKCIDVFEITEDGRFKYKHSFKLSQDTINQYVFKVVFVTWRYNRSVYPLGVVTAVHRTGRDYTSGLELLSVQHWLPSIYPDEVLQQAQQLTANKNLPYESSREDLTTREALTIDPPGSRDLDDALSLWREGHHFIVGVHITDVAAVVLPGSPIDEEARRRSFSFYPPHNKCHNMLPEPLSEGQCSLLEGRSCLCLSVFFRLNENGNQVGEPWVKKTVIRSSWQLTYAEAQTILENGQCGDTDNQLRQSIIQLHRFAALMRKKRLKTSRFFIPFEDSRLRQRGVMSKNRDAHLLVEEWMIAANTFIGTRLSGKFRSMMITRCQPPPSPQDVQDWLVKEGYVAFLPIGLQDKKVTSNKVLSLKTIPSPLHPQQLVELQTDVWRKLSGHLEAGEVEEARRMVFTDSVHPLQCLANAHWMDLMSPAEYRCTYGLNGSQRRHFSLDRDFYTNFTSPLRRYVDLYIQRLLHHDLDGTEPEYQPEDVIELCQYINTVNQRQKSFDKGCRDLDVASRVQAQPLVFRAFLDSVDNDQLLLCLPSLLHTSARSQEIAFTSLGVSRQPEIIVDTMLKKTKATVQWNKRVYDNTGTCPGRLKPVWDHLDKTRSVDMVVSRDRLSVGLKPKDWVSIVSALIRENLSTLKRVPQPDMRLHNKTEVDYMSSEKGNGAVSLRPVHYSTTFTAGQVISVQMSTQSIRGLLKPCVDLMWVARDSSICLRHTKDPVRTLTRSADSSTRGQQFHSHEHYLRAWMPLVEMEAAAGAGYSDAAVTIHNVKVVMNTQETGSFSLKAKFCADRCISIGGKSPDSIPQENPRNKSAFPLDYVCLRYATTCPSQVVDLVRQADLPEALDTHLTWLAHAGVMSVLKKGKKATDGGHLDVTLALCPNSPSPPGQLMTKEGDTVTVEILPKSDVDRRAQELLLHLEDEGCEVARALAYGDTMPELDEDHKRLGEQMEQRDIGVFARDVRPLPRNNASQQAAVSMALTSTLTLIQGPPGTGKTYTGIKLIYLFTLINRELATQGQGSKAVLFCGPSNKSVDLVAKLLREKLGEGCVKMVRVYGSAQEMKEHAVPQGELRSRRGTQDLQCDQQLNDVALHNLIREEGKNHAEELAEFEKLFSQSSSGSQGREGEVNHDLMRRYRKLVFEASVEELRHYEVIFTTCAVAGSQRMMEGLKGRVFQVIIDECAMCPEPLSLIPIVGSRAKQVVLIGDHQQLRPILACSAAADLGLDQSLFERLFSQYPQHAVLLDRQYRMHPQLCWFPSQQFYRGQLKTSVSVSWAQDPLPFWPDNADFGQYQGRALQHEANRKIPHIFVDVRGEEEKKSVPDEEGNENSRSNTEEAKKVVEILRYLKQHHDVHLANVRILTQYKAQRHKLESSIRAECEDRSQKVFDRYDKQHISVSTVVSSQGGEWEYVVLSTVCSLPPYKVEKRCTRGWRRQHLGFITDSHQVNVALTRPRLGLFIVGNQEVLRCDPIWNSLLDDYEKEGCVFPADLFPPAAPRPRPRPHPHPRPQ